MELWNELCKTVGCENVFTNEPMSRHTTFRIGGAADYFVTPAKEEEIWQIISLAKQQNTPYYVIGNGSNLLVGDKGYRGIIIQICKKMNRVDGCGNRLHAQGGALLSKIATTALEHNLTGFEFAAGIPGTLGGAVMMNAGAYGGEMKQVLTEVKVLDENGKIKVLMVEALELGYRSSIFAKKNDIVLSAVIELEKSTKSDIQERLADLKKRRTGKQPLEYPSAGSTFKRPPGFFAGKLIEDAGLSGFRIGDAQVSTKHCGFVINCGQATATEVVSLMEYIVNRVEACYGVRLEPEVKQIGEF